MRAKGMAMTVLGGVGAALAVLSTPAGLMEMIMASSGITEIWPAAAPPLGLKARLLMALFAGVMAMGLIVAMRRDYPEQKDKARDTGADGARKMGFALSKLTAFARGFSTPMAHSATPVLRRAPILRRADAHPDAPPRTPIFASRDFVGLDIFARTVPGDRELVVNAEPEHDPIVPAIGLDMPSAPAPLPDAILTGPSFAAPPPLPVRGDLDAVPAQEPIARPSPVQGLSVAELTERLERGLALRSHYVAAATTDRAVIADMPVVPAVPVREAVAQDVDEALRVALGTLRTMTARAR